MEGESTASQVRPKLFFVLTCIWCFCVVLSTKTEKVPPTKGHPVILVPGDGGTQLWASIDKPATVHYFCREKESWFTLWLNVEDLLPGSIDCFVDNARLVYDNKTRTTSSPTGVNITVVAFGNTSSVEYLDPSKIWLGKYFNAIVDGLVAVGYKRGVSVRGAPYDFRKAPNEAQIFFRNLTRLIEDTYRINGNRKVVLMTHSLGCLYTLYFLNRQSNPWKAKYIQAFAPISGPWAGATKSLRVAISGDNVGDFAVHASVVRTAQRSWPSLNFLLVTDKYWGPHEVIVSTQKKNYTVNDYREVFNDMNYEVGWEVYKDVRGLVYDLKAPGVPVYGIHGRDVPTEEFYVYNEERPFPDYEPYITYGQGDGTVNMRSLKAYMKWQHEQPHPVSEFEISGGEHVHILQNATLIKYLINTVLHLP
ncbi:phospholipase A2 group XV-like [Patiria miniata]|uniref:Group XV phospholipase A2 n=1 Tax=Patiria miniata TaxID=46514 RepID=A0A914B1Q7_PATMI|nr:phospholipase A2 group XV-like [Patiria miniata]